MDYQHCHHHPDSPDTPELLPSRFENVPPAFKSFASKKKTKKAKKLPTYCVFCKNNNESESVYTSHVLKDPDGKVVCPALYVYVCPICNNTGHKAHTVKHCPYNPESLRKQTELAEIWKSYKSKPWSPPPSEPQAPRPRPLINSSQHNTRMSSSSSPDFFFTSSSSSSSPLMSPNSSGYLSSPSSPGYSCYSSPVRQQQQQPQRSVYQHQQQQQQQLQTNENIVYENLIKLLQISS